MKLNEWLTLSGMPAGAFAAKVKVSATSLGRYRRGERVPKTQVMRRIIELTGGAVTPDDFYRELLAAVATATPSSRCDMRRKPRRGQRVA
jgi:hypothetical protein